MIKLIMGKLFWWFTGLLCGLLLGLDVVWARSFDMSKAGVSLWIFLAVGAAIILLQLVPAIILVTTFFAAGMKKKEK